MNSCACCETVRIVYTSEAKRLCFNMVYQRNGLNFDISLDSMIIKAMTVANYRPFQMCSPLPGLLFSSVCVNILELNQFSRSTTVCPRIEVTNKKERWQITYTCVSISTVLPAMNAAAGMTAAAAMQPMPGAMGQMIPGAAGAMGQMMPGAAGAMGQMMPVAAGAMGQMMPGAAGTMGQMMPGAAGTMGQMMPGAAGTMGQMMPGAAGAMGHMMPGTVAGAAVQLRPPTAGVAAMGQAMLGAGAAGASAAASASAAAGAGQRPAGAAPMPGAAPAMMGQMPAAGAMGQRPPAAGAMGQIPPAGAMGAMPPAGATGARPPVGAAGPMPPAGAASPMPPFGAAGPMPPAGAASPMPPAGAAGPMPPFGAAGPMPPAGAASPMPPAGTAGPMTPFGAAGPMPPAGAAVPRPPAGAMGPMPPAGGTPSAGQINPRPGDGANFTARASALRASTTISPKDHFVASYALDQESTTPLYNSAVDSMVSMVQKLMSGESTETGSNLTTSSATNHNEFRMETMVPDEDSDQKMMIENLNESIDTKGDDLSTTTLKRKKRNNYDMFDLLHQSNRCMRAYRICVTRTKHYIVSRLGNTRTGLKTKHTECSDQPARIVYGLEENPCPNLSISESNDSMDITATPETISSTDASQSDDTLDAIVVHDETVEGSDYYPQGNQYMLPMMTAYSMPENFPMQTPPLIPLQVKADLSRSTNETLIYAGTPDEFTRKDLEGLIN
ncbi:mucin-19-like [Nasonia vitripennis]|uniref:DUF4773 domain-containing protein n=1 Tax=Nasonia vitripennis TaxID=7425 RepID=A0A7M7QK74_NASVI|nr:mucin-19-like [Nasonia vitripennis]